MLFLAGFFALLKQLKQYRYASSLRSCWRWRRRYRPPGNAQRYSKHAVAKGFSHKRKQSSDIFHLRSWALRVVHAHVGGVVSQ
eukprot:COSAG06_NODE_1451_length_9435_cov_11.764353_5_plen_83_part_00